jgi:hypothetical protein
MHCISQSQSLPNVTRPTHAVHLFSQSRVAKVDRGRVSARLAADRYNRNPGGVGATLAKEQVAVLHYKVRACAHTLRSPCVCGRGAPADARDAGRVGARMACTRCGTL